MSRYWLPNYLFTYFIFFNVITTLIQSKPLIELALQLNSLSNLPIKKDERYLLHEYLKSMAGNFAIACHESSREPENHKDVTAYSNLLGSGLTFADLGITDKTLRGSQFLPTIMGDFTPWDLHPHTAKGTVGDFSVLVDCDTSLNLYQLRVLTQKESDCSLHSVKNLLWLMAALKANKNQFINYYINMLNPLIYEKFLVSAGCPINPSEAYRHVLDVYTNGHYTKNLPGLPLHSNTYIKNFVELAALSKTTHIIGSIPKGKHTIKTYQIQSDLDSINVSIRNTEPELNEQELDNIMNIITILLGSDKFKYPIENLPAIFEKVHHSANYLLGIYLLVSTGAPAHATSLIINKFDNQIEYLFCDPLNWPFTRRGNLFHGYKSALKTIISLVNNPTLLKETMARYLYTKALEHHNIDKIVNQMLASQAYQTSVYQKKYKASFCTFIRPYVHTAITEESYSTLCSNE